VGVEVVLAGPDDRVAATRGVSGVDPQPPAHAATSRNGTALRRKRAKAGELVTRFLQVDVLEASRVSGSGVTPNARTGGQRFGRSVQITVISVVVTPSALVIVTCTGNSGRVPDASSATTSAAGRPSTASARSAPVATFL